MATETHDLQSPLRREKTLPVLDPRNHVWWECKGGGDVEIFERFLPKVGYFATGSFITSAGSLIFFVVVVVVVVAVVVVVVVVDGRTTKRAQVDGSVHPNFFGIWKNLSQSQTKGSKGKAKKLWKTYTPEIQHSLLKEGLFPKEIGLATFTFQVQWFAICW